MPEEISSSFGERGYIYVKGKANGYLFRSTLIPRGAGCHKLFLNGEIREAIKAGEGDEVHLTVERDALASHPEAKKQFHEISTAYRREILLWINEAKRPQTRLNRIEKALKRLVERARST